MAVVHCDQCEWRVQRDEHWDEKAEEHWEDTGHRIFHTANSENLQGDDY